MTILSRIRATLDPDALDVPVIALRLDIVENENEPQFHQHHKAQLVVALRGGVTCETVNGLWMVPPQFAVWIPGGIRHAIRVTANALLCFLYVNPAAVKMPEQCCTLSVTPLLRELIQRLAVLPAPYEQNTPTARLAYVLLEELSQMKVEQLYVSMSEDPRIRKMADMLLQNPADRSKVAEWGARFAMSERTLTRLLVRETGMTFGRWRQQLHIILALQRLSAGALVQRVAEDLGYESVNAFITMFRKVLGRPPARYFSERNGKDEA
jgi:AraC-like DNA-binding protein